MEEIINESDYSETYPDRKYDFCEAEKKIIADLAGINRRSMITALNDLERNLLIEPIGSYYGWKALRSGEATISKYIMDGVWESFTTPPLPEE